MEEGKNAMTIFPSQVYRWKCNLTTHQRLECGQEPRFSCPACPHRSKFRGNLFKHLLSKHPEIDAENFRRELHRKEILLKEVRPPSNSSHEYNP